ncbi:hypothetical protein FSPOR_9070 [Fusarium sporotrichioides]|uniref:Uncharacterized protein n=1 Tax=Fusarium sporotrichioides TaxID=5514 RepID=A0A395RRP9_FUSSP|nr:hypothetical protein FSPOR_9070 [Fusarium sporotrichioides]
MTCGLRNEWLILSEISRRARLLVEATETAISLMPPSSDFSFGLDLLPAIQAMLIYQFMRLFSAGDIVQQTQAEADGKVLARWVNILQEQTQWSSNSSADGGRLDLSVWKDWVYVESTKRTLVFAEMLDGVYNYLRFGWYEPSVRMAKLSFTGKAAIWEAKTSAEWEQARVQQLWLEFDMSCFRDDIKAAFPDDVDELGIIILASYDGLDALKKWAGDDERLLEKWGLSSI